MIEDHKKRNKEIPKVEDPTKALDDLIGQAKEAVNQAIEPN